MPLGVLLNASSVAIGGIVGSIVGRKLPEDWKENLNMVLSICSMCMGISTIILMKNMPAVVFAVLFGTAIGSWIHLGNFMNNSARKMQSSVSKLIKSNNNHMNEAEFTTMLVTVIVLFCTSGTGIYGSIISGMTGDHSILIAKSILDFFSSTIFACGLGLVVSFIAIPQLLIFLILFCGAGLIYPFCTPEMIDDFKACGGFLMLATGFRMAKIKIYPTADMIPAMILVLPVSWIWTTYILPFVK